MYHSHSYVRAQIIDNGHAYAVAGDVYFTVDSFPEYGALSGRKQEENRAGERVAVDERKKNPADFALWKVSRCGNSLFRAPLIDSLLTSFSGETRARSVRRVIRT